MKSTQFVLRTFAFSILFSTVLAHAATVTGTVTDKTTGKPSAGDTVVLVDVQAGMGEVAKATTDARGHYSLNKPGSGPYLIRVTHQNTGYFIAAPDGPGPGDIPVYDAAPKVDGISIEADVLEIETENGQLKVNERYFVHNTSSPPRTQYSPHGFEVVLPADAVVDGTAARRPTGLPTATQLTPGSQKGHFTFDFPIQPDEGDKNTLFQIEYHIPYGSGKYTFHPQEALAADNVAVLLPKSITFTAGTGANFQPVPEDPGIQTFVLKNAAAGKAIEFTVAGTGSMPREGQGAPAGQQGAGMGAPSGDSGSGDAAAQNNKPGGGIGTPIGTDDPLTKYKWWILGALALVLVAGAAFFLRKPNDLAGVPNAGYASAAGNPPAFGSPAAKNAALLNALKEELFALESEKLSGTLSAEEYAEVKAAVETVLKRALKRK
jgi:hypothetical protein